MKDCALEPHLRLKRSQPQAGLKLGTARSVGQCFTSELAGLLPIEKKWQKGDEWLPLTVYPYT